MVDRPILLLAAGAAARMGGRDKLLEAVDGLPLLGRHARQAVAAAIPVFVTLPPHAPRRCAALSGLAVSCVTVPDADTGMAASLRAGVASLPAAAEGVLVALADMPELTTADYAAILAAARTGPRDRVIRATTAEGRPGHPVLFPRRLFPALGRLRGDTGARSVLAAEGDAVRHIALPGERALTDLDTPAAWAEWRRRTGR